MQSSAPRNLLHFLKIRQPCQSTSEVKPAQSMLQELKQRKGMLALPCRKNCSQGPGIKPPQQFCFEATDRHLQPLPGLRQIQEIVLRCIVHEREGPEQNNLNNECTRPFNIPQDELLHWQALVKTSLKLRGCCSRRPPKNKRGTNSLSGIWCLLEMYAF